MRAAVGAPRHAPRHVPAALGVAVLGVTALAAVVAVRGHDPLRGVAYGLLGWAAAGTVLLLGRRAPGPAVAAAGAFAAAGLVLVPGPPFVLLPFAVGVVLAMVRGARVWAIATVGCAYLVPLVLLFTSESPVVAARVFATMAILLVALGGGAALRARAERRRQEAREQADAQRIAVERERVRIARELHDVLAHSLSTISVQAGVGLHLAEQRPQAAVEALTAIRGASGAALDEVRVVLGVLRGDDTAPRTPGPDLDAVEALVAAARRTGARVALTDTLRPRPAMAVQLALYRVVQESLTNARRHAAGAAVEVELRRGPDGDAVARVRDRLPGAAPRPPVAGNGITGMAERAAALGGTFELVTHPDGVEVAVRIPDPAGVA